MKQKKMIALLLALVMVFAMAACGSGSSDGTYTVGICQLMAHPSLDSATQGFKDALIAELGEDKVKFLDQDAGGDFTNCGTIMDGFVAENVDMILANATAPLQAAQSATNTIPVLGTSITDYASALGIENWTGTVGSNISGTTDLAPLDQQAGIIQEPFPDAETVGMLYCSSEPNSIYQVEVVEGYLTGMGYAVERYPFTDANDLASVTQTACDNVDVIYVPTDNVAATYPETIANVVLPAAIPVVTGDSSTCAACGVAVLGISYYDLGYITGKMAAEVLTGKTDISAMPVQSAPEATKQYNPTVCEQLGITPPEGYVPVG